MTPGWSRRPNPARGETRFSAGHSVSGVESIGDVAALMDRVEQELDEARHRTAPALR